MFPVHVPCRPQMEVASVESSLDLLGLTDDDVLRIYEGRVPTGMRAAPTRPMDLSERCAFCKGVETQTDDLIFCDRCNMCVHPGCYLIQRMPAEDEPWYCEPCADAVRTEAKAGTGGRKDGKAASKGRDRVATSSAASTSTSASASAATCPTRPSSKAQKRSGSASASAPKPPKCSVCCNSSDRALRRVSGGGYVHLSCATFHDGPTVEVDAPVGDVDAIGKQWYKLRCQFCDGWGAAVQCSYGACTRAYHVPCGLENGALFAIKTCPAPEGADHGLENEVHRLNVCPVHRRHVRAVANAYDRRVVDVDAAKRSRKRKGSRNSSSSSSSARAAAAAAVAAHVLKVSCPTCRQAAGVDLRAANMGLRPATALAARADAWRLAHPEEDEELLDIIAKYPNSRAHDGSSSSSSSDESDAEKEAANGRRAAAAAGSAAAAAASSAAAPAAVSASSSSSRSRSNASALSAAAAAPSRTSSRTSPARPARAASNSSASSARPDTQRPGRGGAGVCVSPSSSLARLPSPPPSGSSARTNSRAARRLQVQSGEPAAATSSAVAAASSSRKAAAVAAVPAAPLTPSKRKQQSTVSIAAPPSRRVHVDLCSEMDDDDEEEEAEEEEEDEDEDDADMDEILRAAPSPASSSGSAMPSASLRMARSHSEPAPAASPPDGAAVAAAAAAHGHASPRRKAAFAAAPAPASSSVRPQPQAVSSPASRKRTSAARPASSAGMGSSSPTRGYDPHLSLEIDGLEIIECHRPAPLSSKRARVAAPAPRLPSVAAAQPHAAAAHDEPTRVCSSSASATAAASAPHRSGSTSAGASTGDGASPMDEEQGDEDEGDMDDDDDDGDGDDDEAQRVAAEGEALMRLESLDSYLKQQMMSGEFLPPAAAGASPASSSSSSAASPSALVAVAPLSVSLRSHLHSVRSALRVQQTLLSSSSLSSSLRARVPMVVDSLDTLLQSLLKLYLPDAALTRRSARNKTPVAQQIDHIVAASIDPMLAIHQ